MSQIGKDPLTDPPGEQFKDLLALLHRIAAEEEGSGAYEAKVDRNTRTVTRKLSWTSAGLHGMDRRIVVAEDTPK